MAKRKQIDEETFNKIRDLLDYGLKQHQIANIIGCSPVTIYRIKKSGARDYETWRAVVKTYNQPKPKKTLEPQVDTENIAPEQAPDEEGSHELTPPSIAVERNETAEAIRELTAVMRELVQAWEGNQTKKRRLF